MDQIHHYKVTCKVSNEPGVLARISVLLRKFNINIRSLDTAPIDNEEHFNHIHIDIATKKSPEQFAIVIRKMERLIPVVEISYSEM